MAKFMTVKELKEKVTNITDDWDDWVVLVNDEPISDDEFIIQVSPYMNDEVDEYE